MNIEEQVLSREQMAHLRLLGVDTSDASMMWYCCNKKWYLQINNELSQGMANVMNRADLFVPAYTIGDLIEKLPKHIDGGYETYLSITDDQLFGDWCVCYESKWGSETDWFTSSNLLTALYDCLCWVAENHKKLIK